MFALLPSSELESNDVVASKWISFEPISSSYFCFSALFFRDRLVKEQGSFD